MCLFFGFPVWLLGAPLSLLLCYIGVSFGALGGGHLRLSGGLPGPPRGAILGLPGAFLGLLIFDRSRKEPEGPPKGPGEGPGAEKK